MARRGTMHERALDAAKGFPIQGAKEPAALSRTTTSNHDDFVVYSFKSVSGCVVVLLVSTRTSMLQRRDNASDILNTCIGTAFSRSSIGFLYDFTEKNGSWSCLCPRLLGRFSG